MQNNKRNLIKGSRELTTKTLWKFCWLFSRALKTSQQTSSSLFTTINPISYRGRRQCWIQISAARRFSLRTTLCLVRRDRKTDDHGGVISACKKDIIVTERKEFSSESEMLWHQIELKGRSSILLGTVYKPNLKHNDAVTVDNLQNVLTKINHKMPNNNITVCGDFNQPNVDWNNLCMIPSTWACSISFNSKQVN